MLVELTTSRATAKTFHNVGDIIDVSNKEGRRLIETGQAIPANTKPVEMAVLEQTERAVKRPARRRKPRK